MDSNTRTSQYDKALITISRYGFEISPLFALDDSNTGKKILSKKQYYESMNTILSYGFTDGFDHNIMDSNTKESQLGMEYDGGRDKSENSMTHDKDVSHKDLQAMKNMVHDYFYSPDLFIRHSPVCVKSHLSDEMVRPSSPVVRVYHDKTYTPATALQSQVLSRM